MKETKKQEVYEHAHCSEEGCKESMYNTLIMLFAAGWVSVRQAGIFFKWYCPKHAPKDFL